MLNEGLRITRKGAKSKDNMASASLSDYPTAPPSTAEVIGEDDMQQQDPGKSDGNGSQPQCEALKEYQMESRREREARRLFLRCNASMGSTLIWEHCCQGNCTKLSAKMCSSSIQKILT